MKQTKRQLRPLEGGLLVIVTVGALGLGSAVLYLWHLAIGL